MTWKLMMTAQNKWRRLRGYKLLADVIKGVQFKNGERVKQEQLTVTSDFAVHQI